jgi:hypothetical protein
MNIQASKPAKIRWKKVLIVAVLLLIAGYKWYSENAKQPDMQSNDVAVEIDDSRYDAKLPEDFDSDNRRSSDGHSKTETVPTNRASSAKRAADFLVPIGNNKLQSPAGLVYGMGGGGEHRVDHVMRHAKDDSSRPSHGVFDGDKESILELLDEAYEMVKSQSRYVKSESSRGNTAYTISMGRVIGYEGGQKGKRSNHKSLRSIRLVLDGDRVITAYPYR